MAAAEVIQYRVCDRCFAGGKEVTAAATDKLALNGHRFEIDLCTECSAELYTLVMHTWGDLGVKAGEPTVFDAARPISTKPVPVIVHPSGATEDMVQPALQSVPEVAPEEIPLSAQQWVVTAHAREQMALRGFTLRDVLMAAERPEVTTQQVHDYPGQHPSDQFRRRGRCTVAVNSQNRTVVTVLVAGETKKSWTKVEA